MGRGGEQISNGIGCVRGLGQPGWTTSPNEGDGILLLLSTESAMARRWFHALELDVMNTTTLNMMETS